jgi:alkaline phosphatase D
MKSEILRQMTRRELLAGAVMGHVLSGRGITAFPLGIASGDPAPDGFVLWTRLVPVDSKPIAVRWELAMDEGFRRVVRRGEEIARAEAGHSVHVELQGLAAGRWYWYRFFAGGESSAVGRARTMPAAGQVERLRFAVASCQKWQDGYFTAYRHMAEEELDLVVHLGDYIYETSSKPQAVRPHSLPEAVTLGQYRDRYALYKSDVELQKVHAKFPWIVTWDDHETADNYAGLIPDWDSPRETFPHRRAAAYQAYWENMPLRRVALPRGHDMTLYRRLNYGGLATFHVLDARQYRSDQPCGDKLKPSCAERELEARTMLGTEQEQWLAAGMAGSKTNWQVLAQQVIFAPLDCDPGPGELFPMDKWDGYPAARDRVLKMFEERRRANGKFMPVVLTGDNHNHWAFHLKRKGAVVGSEFAGTSITSNGDGADVSEEYKGAVGANDHLLFHRSRRGYLSCDVTAERWMTRYQVVPYVTREGSPLETPATFVLERGNPAAVRT